MKFFDAISMLPWSAIHILCLRTMAIVDIFTGLRLHVIFGIAKACLSGSALSLGTSRCSPCSTRPFAPRARLWQSDVQNSNVLVWFCLSFP